MTTIHTVELTEQHDKSKFDFETEFIFGSRSVNVVDLRHNTHLEMDLREAATEDNFRDLFSNLVEALRQTGKLRVNGNVLCTTFPAGSMKLDTSVVN